MNQKINGYIKYQINEITQLNDEVISFLPKSNINCQSIQEELNSINENNIKCDFIIKDKLGEGAFGAVHLGINKQTGENVAIKILEKSKIKNIEGKIRIEREIEILKKLKHPNIVQLYCVIETYRQIFLIMEYIKGKELFKYILLKKKLSEEEACFYFQQIISGIEYLNKLKIAHRDIKCENIIIEENTKIIKILDFGLSNTYGDKPNEMLSTACGSPCYAAPEMLCGKLYKGSCVDIWSAGVVLFTMICGFLPFLEESNKEMYKKIIEGKYSIPPHVSKIGRELIYKLLDTNPKKRIKISEIKKHSWIKFYSNGLNKEGKPLFNTGLFIDKYVIPIDEDIIDEIELLFKIPKIKMRAEILSNSSNDYTSLYYLLLNKKIKNGKESIADLKSDLFISYLQDDNNLLSNYKNDIQNVIGARKMGFLYEKKNIENNKDKNLNNNKSDSNIKSQDNIYNIFFKNKSNERKTIDYSNYNSSVNLKNNSNNKIIKSKTNNSIIIDKNKSIKIKKFKNKNIYKLNIENNNQSYTNRNISKNIFSKTTYKGNNYLLKSIFTYNSKTKTIQENYLDTDKRLNHRKVNSLFNTVTLSPIIEKNKILQISQKNSNRIPKKNLEIIKNKTTKSKSNQKEKKLKKRNILKIYYDNLESKKLTKSFEEHKTNFSINEFKENNKNLKNKEEENKNENYNIGNNKKKNIIEVKVKDNSNQKNILNNEIISKNIKEQNNKNIENKFIDLKTLESFSVQTINKEKYDMSNYNTIKNMADLNSFITLSDREGEEKNKSNSKNNSSYKNKKILNNLQEKNNNLMNQINEQLLKYNYKKDIKINDESKINKSINNKIIQNINDKNIHYKYNFENKTHKKLKSFQNNLDIKKNNKILKKGNLTYRKIDSYKDIKINLIYNMKNDKLIKNEENKSKNLINKNKSNYNSFLNKSSMNVNSKYSKKFDKFINTKKLKNNFSNIENSDNKYKLKEINYKYINSKCTIDNYKNQKKNNFNLKKYYTFHKNIENNTNFKFNSNKKFCLSNLINKKLINNNNNRIKHNNIDNIKDYNSNIQELVNNLKQNNHLLYRQTLNSNIISQLKNKSNTNNNFYKSEKMESVKIKSIYDTSKNNNNYNNSMYKIKNNTKELDLEPFDLNCIFILSIKTIKEKLLNQLKKLKYKVKQINSYKYSISYGENKDIFELNLKTNYLNIIKFKKLKPVNNHYINNLKKIMCKIN